jgi:hypothetical protein
VVRLRSRPIRVHSPARAPLPASKDLLNDLPFAESAAKMSNKGLA